VISLPRRSLARRQVIGRNASFESAMGRIRGGEPELFGMASSLPISQTGCPLYESGKDA